MKALDRRLAHLERTGGNDLWPAAKKWLGMPLTGDEQAALDRGEGEGPPNVDVNTLSREMREWLGV